MERGEIWWASLPPRVGRRPVLLVSRNEAYRLLTSPVVVSITTRVRGIRTEIVLDEHDGMPQTCAINFDNILTVAQSDLVEHIITLGPLQMQLVDQALKFALTIEA